MTDPMIVSTAQNGAKPGVTVEETIVVGLGEVKVSRDAGIVLTCLGLGSCVAIAAYDPVTRVAGMAHIVLPVSSGTGPDRAPKFADVGVPHLLKEMRKQGAMTSRLIVKIAGGAQMSRAPGLDDAFKIGDKNIQAVQEALERAGVPVAAADTGGNQGRTLRTYLDTGTTVVSRAGKQLSEL